MVTVNYDLENYKEWLWSISDDLEQLPDYKARLDRVSWILYLISCRNIKGKQTPKGEQVRMNLEAEQSVLTTKIERAEQSKCMYLDEAGVLYQSRAGICHFFPDWNERIEIDQLRAIYLRGCKKEYWDTLRATALPKSVLVERTISEIKYTYTEYYESGTPIAYVSDRKQVIIRFISDLGKFDFLQFLLAENESKGTFSTPKSFTQKTIYDELFDSPYKLEFVEKMLVDKGFWLRERTLIGERDKYKIRALCDALKDKGIVPDLNLNVLCDSFLLRLGIQSDRIRDRSKDYEFCKDQYIRYINRNYCPI